MRRRLFSFWGAPMAVLMAGLNLPISVSAQSGLAAVEKAAAALAPRGWTVPRTPDGQPDLGGIWTNGFLTPVERPAELSGKAFFTKEEAGAFEMKRKANSNRDRRDTTNAQRDVQGSYNEAWWDSGNKVTKTLQTSLVVDPLDGRIPPLTPEAQKSVERQKQAIAERCSQPGETCLDATGSNGLVIPADGPEDRSFMERCISWVQGGPPMMPSTYNNNYQIVQVPGYVLIFVEMLHEARMIPLDGRPHIPSDVRQLMGDPRGHWEGNTLVVDSTNFSDETKYSNSAVVPVVSPTARNMHLVERFTRTDPTTILYEFTVDDTTTFTKPWSGAIAMESTKGPIYEYECNEGNAALAGILRGARVAEKGGNK